jgi:hypothetical protein
MKHTQPEYLVHLRHDLHRGPRKGRMAYLAHRRGDPYQTFRAHALFTPNGNCGGISEKEWKIERMNTIRGMVM